jgi:hypothetical protein
MRRKCFLRGVRATCAVVRRQAFNEVDAPINAEKIVRTVKVDEDGGLVRLLIAVRFPKAVRFAVALVFGSEGIMVQELTLDFDAKKANIDEIPELPQELWKCK